MQTPVYLHPAFWWGVLFGLSVGIAIVAGLANAMLKRQCAPRTPGESPCPAQGRDVTDIRKWE